MQAILRYDRVNGATVNDAKMADLVIETAGRLLGEENVETDTRTLGGEDMSVFLDRVPGCFFFVGCARPGGHRPHHSPRFDFDERALAIGTTVMEAVLREAARRGVAGVSPESGPALPTGEYPGWRPAGTPALSRPRSLPAAPAAA